MKNQKISLFRTESMPALMKRVRKETKNFTQHGNWCVLKCGDLIYKDGGFKYRILKSDLMRENWIEHINGKNWGSESISDFIWAYSYALNKIGAKISIVKEKK